MRILYSTITILISILGGCSTSDRPAHSIVGTWEVVDSERPFISVFRCVTYELIERPLWYSFNSDSIVEISLGFLSYPEMKFYGNTSKYRATKESVDIFNPAQNTWQRFDMHWYSNDTVRLTDSEGMTMTLVATNKEQKPVLSIDQIQIVTGPSIFQCPPYDLLVTRSGVSHLFVSGKNKELVEHEKKKEYIFSRFERIALTNMDSVYDHPELITDDRYIQMTFMNEGRKLHSIEGVSSSLPVELRQLLILTDDYAIGETASFLNSVGLRNE